MNPTVAVFGILRFPPDRLKEALPHLQRLVEETRLIRFSELWPDKDSLDRHLQAPHIEPWRAAARACGLQERKFTAYAIHGHWAV